MRYICPFSLSSFFFSPSAVPFHINSFTEFYMIKWQRHNLSLLFSPSFLFSFVAFFCSIRGFPESYRTLSPRYPTPPSPLHPLAPTHGTCSRSIERGAAVRRSCARVCVCMHVPHFIQVDTGVLVIPSYCLFRRDVKSVTILDLGGLTDKTRVKFVKRAKKKGTYQKDLERKGR